MQRENVTVWKGENGELLRREAGDKYVIPRASFSVADLREVYEAIADALHIEQPTGSST